MQQVHHRVNGRAHWTPLLDERDERYCEQADVVFCSRRRAAVCGYSEIGDFWTLLITAIIYSSSRGSEISIREYWGKLTVAVGNVRVSGSDDRHMHIYLGTGRPARIS
jgi:hypothetical protein